jgi:ornithine cyclodeaminase/alanine dehydrogenase-like protein (mu-crystallin family)
VALEDAHVLGLIGSGRLARWAAEAVCAVRPIHELRVWSPTPAHRAECARYLQARAGGATQVRGVGSAKEAVRGAQIVVTATNAPGPVLLAEWLDPGCTLLTNRPEELDYWSARRGRIVTTYREGVLGHVPPYQALVPIFETGLLQPETFATELADIVVGRVPGRYTPEEIIVCLNPAYGVLDAATAEYVYQRAVETGVGTELAP